MKIYKYPIAITDRQMVMIPRGGMILSAQSQHGKLCLWVMVDPENEVTPRTIEIIGTGNPMPPLTANERRKFIDTAQMMSGELVWHVFELGRG